MRSWVAAFALLPGCGTEPSRDAGARVETRDAAPAKGPGPAGRAIVRNDCLGCHSEDLIEQQRLTQKQWTKVLEKMHRWGAPTEPEKTASITEYLAATYRVDAAAYEMATVSADADTIEPRPDGPFAGGDPARGRALYDERCRACHGEDGRGGPLGVNLVDRYLLWRAADFAAVVRAGRGRMPAFAETDADVGHMLAHLRTLRP